MRVLVAARRHLGRPVMTAVAALALGGGAWGCCWSAKQYRAARPPEARPLQPHAPLRVVIDAPTVRTLLAEVPRRQPTFRGPFAPPTLTHKLGRGCRAPAFGECDPCRDYALLHACSPLRLGTKPCQGQPTQSDGKRLRWANQPCGKDEADCAVLATGFGVALGAERLAYEITLRRVDLRLGEGRLTATVDFGGLKARGDTRLTVLDRCGKPTQLPLVRHPERCEGVEAGIDHKEPIRLEGGLVLEWRGQELRGRLEGDVRLSLPPGGAYLKQTCYRGSVLGVDLGALVQREGIGALEREWPRREAEAQRALTAWLSDRLSRPLVDAIPASYRVSVAGGEVAFFPHLEKVAVTPAAITVLADAQVLVPYGLITSQLKALGRVRASRPDDDPLWLSDLRAELGPGGTLLLRAAYEYQWKRGGIVGGGGRGQLAFAARGELVGGILRVGEVQLLAMDPADAGYFDDRVRRKVEAALKGDEIRRLEIKLQAQYEAAVERLRATRVTRDGLSVELHPEALTALATFEREGVRLHLGGNLRPRLVPAAVPTGGATR